MKIINYLNDPLLNEWWLEIAGIDLKSFRKLVLTEILEEDGGLNQQ